MDVEKYKEGVKKRREERLRLLRRKQRLESSSTEATSLLNREEEVREKGYYSMIPAEPEQREDVGLLSPWIIKVIVTILLVVGVYVVMNSSQQSMAGTQDFIYDVFHREFNVAGVMSWYEEKAGGTVSFLPKLLTRSNQDEQSYGVPVSGGKVVLEFGQDQQGIVVGTQSNLPVEVIKEGRVKAVRNIQNLGPTIVIDHGEGEESWYGQLQDIKVQQNEWVEKGQVIGYTSGSEIDGQGTFYFALKQDATFIDPLEVISFD